MIGYYDQWDFDLGKFWEHEKIVDQLTVQEVNELIRQMFDLEHYSVVKLLLEAATKPDGDTQ